MTVFRRFAGAQRGYKSVMRTAVAGWAIACALLAGCAEQQIRDESRVDIVGGNYEHAIQVLDDGLKRYPESITLRSALLQARAAAVNGRITSASALRATGRLDEAEIELQLAKALDPANARLDSLLLDVATERRQQAAVSEAEQSIAKKRPDIALRTVEQALKDNPRHPGLVALQRRLSIEQRQAQVRAAHTPLAETRPISLDFRDASLRAVLDVVSRNSGVNFILDKDIRTDTRVTVFLRQARVEDALDLITSTNQLAKKVIDAQTIVVYPNTPEKQREYQEQIVRVFYLASADAKGAAAFLKSMLKIRDPFVDERSNMLALRESQENIQLAERLITLFDAAEPEVMLEVEVLEVSSSRLTELGVQFPTSFSLSPLAPDGSNNLTLGNIRGLTRDRISLGLGGITVNLRREVGDFTTLANPKIRTRNKQKAKVLIGDKIPIVTTTTGQTGFVSDSVNYLDVGLKLDVEPTIFPDDDVSINLSLEVSSLGSAVKTSSGTLAYQISTRNASTFLRLHDGETQLLAGLISRSDSANSNRVPGLGDLPGVGRLFSDQVDNSKRTELMLAITPRVLRNVHQPDASESEMWVGTEALPRLRPVGGLRQDAKVDGEPVPGRPGSNVPASMAPMLDSPGPASTAPAPAPQFLTWAGPGEAKAGDVVELKLTLKSATALRGVPMEFMFSKDKLQLVDVAEGDFFRQDGAATSFSKSGDGKDGKLNVGVLRNQGTGVTGQGTIVTLRFKALAAGAAEVRLINALPIALGASAPPTVLPQPFVWQVK